jgi:hypothetical protein
MTNVYARYIRLSMGSKAVGGEMPNSLELPACARSEVEGVLAD